MVWLTDHPGLAWLALALLLGAVEVATLDFFFIMLALGALAAAVVGGVLGAGLVAQVVALGVVTLVLVGGLRPALVRRLRSTPSTRTGAAALIGQDAVVLQTVSTTDGRVRLRGEVWSARLAARSLPHPVLPGQPVRVVAIEGATAIVTPLAPEPEI